MPIKILSQQLTNQIAAGEVVNRPASVVKELLENSLDAGANRIDIFINKGGTQLIGIRDNGCGIEKEELTLALANHATSKISTLDDLNAITTLGFRGEALASICSVSRLKLTSRTKRQSEAWQVYTEGHAMPDRIKPTAHPVGTTLEVWDLFYNIPARRKFLKTDKTEFIHIEDVVRRIALARFDVTITLKHNGKLIQQYRNSDSNCQFERRIAAICGKGFISDGLTLECQEKGLKLHGWLVISQGLRIPNDLQYFYVNGRIIKNRFINNAIRQACHNTLGKQYEGNPKFILYLDIDPQKIDVNVHPTKHDVRFHQSRLLHDFIYQVIVNLLQNKETVIKNLSIPTSMSYHKNDINILESSDIFYNPKNRSLNSQSNLSPNCHWGRVISIIINNIALIHNDVELILIALPATMRYLKILQLDADSKYWKPRQLIIPLRFKIEKNECQLIKSYGVLLKKIGIKLVTHNDYAILHVIPLPLYKLNNQNLQDLIYQLLRYLSQNPDEEKSIKKIVQWLANYLVNQLPSWDINQAIDLLSEITKFCPQLLCTPPPTLLQRVSIEKVLSAFKNELIE
ncbi:MAG: DNA mismatch repair endonuclease MutL [Candidatus Dasytiphilus stammeri]